MASFIFTRGMVPLLHSVVGASIQDEFMRQKFTRVNYIKHSEWHRAYDYMESSQNTHKIDKIKPKNHKPQ